MAHPLLEISKGQNSPVVQEEGCETHESPRASSESNRGLLTFTGSLSIATNQAPLNLSFTHSLALVLGLQIGSGIFSAPSQVSAHVLSPFEGILIWILGGILAWTGACSFIELGLAIPRNGGIQEYLQECYGDFLGCLFTWSWILLVKPSANAVIATVLSDYLCRGAIGYDEAPIWLTKLVSVLAVIVVAVVNSGGKKMGASAANWFMGVKMAIVISITAIGLTVCVGKGDGVPSEGGWFDNDPTKSTNLWDRFGDLATALFGALFCYGGWESVSTRNDTVNGLLIC
jgi:L-type amino acid transporter 6